MLGFCLQTFLHAVNAYFSTQVTIYAAFLVLTESVIPVFSLTAAACFSANPCRKSRAFCWTTTSGNWCKTSTPTPASVVCARVSRFCFVLMLQSIFVGSFLWALSSKAQCCKRCSYAEGVAWDVFSTSSNNCSWIYDHRISRLVALHGLEVVRW